jgi:hypothetical protein
VKREANCACDEKFQAQKQRRQAWSAARVEVRAWGRIPPPNLIPQISMKKRRGK